MTVIGALSSFRNETKYLRALVWVADDSGVSG